MTKNKLILGIDEAGKGPVLGPLLICGYMIKEENLSQLVELGAKDSKLLSPGQRQRMEKKLKELSHDFILLSIPASEIDRLRSIKNLNRIEIEHVQKIINLLEPDKAIIDAIEANTKKFAEKIKQGITCRSEIIAENFADKRYPVVGAASILAKVQRDREIRKISDNIGEEIGSGYPSDERTIKFLKNWMNNKGNNLEFVRHSWLTFELIKKENEQKKLEIFFKDRTTSAGKKKSKSKVKKTHKTH